METRVTVVTVETRVTVVTVETLVIYFWSYEYLMLIPLPSCLYLACYVVLRIMELGEWTALLLAPFERFETFHCPILDLYAAGGCGLHSFN